MVPKLNNFWWLLFCGLYFSSTAQETNEGVKLPKITDYKNDTSYIDFSKIRFDVAKAQIISLKTGALLVRLKTNINTINSFKVAGNMDMATQLERETEITNKIIIASYLNEFTFCPVYFFYSNASESVKNKKLSGIFIDTTLIVNPSIICTANYYLIAEGSFAYNSSLGFVTESYAPKAIERGTATREVAIVIKNRFFIQLHKPFPYLQIKRSFKPVLMETTNQQGICINLTALHSEIKKMLNNNIDAKQLIGLRNCVRALNERFVSFYNVNKNFIIPDHIKQFVY